MTLRNMLSPSRQIISQTWQSPEVLRNAHLKNAILLSEAGWGSRDALLAANVKNPAVPQLWLCGGDGTVPPVVQRLLMHGVARVAPIIRQGKTIGVHYADQYAEYCMLTGILPENMQAPRADQATSVFFNIEDALRDVGMTFANVVRTWLYIDEVCDWYNEFNAARSAFFDTRNVFETFLPASTGIGSANLAGAALTACAIAVKPRSDAMRISMVDSPLQAPAMAYKSSFSRAAEIEDPDRRILFISGTASIMPNSHDVAYVGDIEKQIDCTMTAVAAILESRAMTWENTVRAVAYLKKPEFREAWYAWLNAHQLPQNFATEIVADVCRDEWLFELELDAVELQEK